MLFILCIWRKEGREEGREGGRIRHAKRQSCEAPIQVTTLQEPRVPYERGRKKRREQGKREGGRKGRRAYLVDLPDVELEDGALSLLVAFPQKVEE
jgi:hypothetical protein